MPGRIGAWVFGPAPVIASRLAFEADIRVRMGKQDPFKPNSQRVLLNYL